MYVNPELKEACVSIWHFGLGCYLIEYLTTGLSKISNLIRSSSVTKVDEWPS